MPSHLRVVSNSSAAELGYALSQLDKGLIVTSSSKYRLDMTLGGAVPTVWTIGRVLAGISLALLLLLLGIGFLRSRGR